MLETIFALEEAVWAVEGIQSASDLPLVVSFSFDMGTRTMMGLSPTDAVAAVVPLGVAAVGANCGRSLADTDGVVTEVLAAAGDVPVWVKPNAGVPKIVGAEVVYEAGPEMLAEHVARLCRAGRPRRRRLLRVDAGARRGDRARHSAAELVVFGAGALERRAAARHVAPVRMPRRGGVPLRRLARRGRSVVVAAAAAPHPGQPRLAVRVTLGVRGLQGLLAPPARAYYDNGEGSEGAPEGAWLDEWIAFAGEDERRAQTRFQREWLALKRYANERGIRLIGDIPLYVAGDSCDALDAPELFDRSVVAGAAPSLNHPEGQRWGMPVFDWPAHAAEGYAWWLSRIERELELFDLLRIDHFRGLVKFWELPLDEPDPAKGFWGDGPGMAFFDAARERLGGLPLILEDLGHITPDVIELRDALALPGMNVVARVSDIDWRTDSVLYTSTHDSDTLGQLVAALGPREPAAARRASQGRRERAPRAPAERARGRERARRHPRPGSARARRRGPDEPAREPSTARTGSGSWSGR